ncbi:uncharacterized protein LOC108677027 [Hyalella azteca]|uniref:Uncharacterized protein LOC108677027 n=1 Tax=Hyalella azteca TaxID=294128 RepID=A0A8B7P6D1_HYAAZ|nr:uncharacterized protein LOC108677027 [Hyalella azteca]
MTGSVRQLLWMVGVATLALVVMATLASSAPSPDFGSTETDMPKRTHKNFLRFGRNQIVDDVYDNLVTLPHFELHPLPSSKRNNADRNFIRYGRGDLRNRNFIRFGRGGSVHPSSHLPNPHAAHVVTQHHDEFPHSEGEGKPQSRSKRSLGEGGNLSTHEEREHLGERGKRALPNLMALVNNHDISAPLNWLPDTDDMAGFRYDDSSEFEEDHDEDDLMALQEIQKRQFPLNFVRYGREPSDWNFIRFGKRGDGSDEEFGIGGDLASPLSEFDSIANARNRNFIRFGRR